MKFILFIFIELSFVLLSCTNKKEVEVKKEYFKVEVNVVPPAGGSVELVDLENNSFIENPDSVLKGTRVKLIPTANDGYNFAGFWENEEYLNDENPILEVHKDFVINSLFRVSGRTPVEVYGDLSVTGSQIVDDNQVPVQLRGMSFFWSQWMGKYWNEEVVNWLTLDWEVSVVRAAMGVDENGGYIYNKTEKAKVETIVDAAIETGIYVIIDWHSHHAEDYTQQAVDFFCEMAQKYGQHPNVIYEIYNEPLAVSWTGTIKPYAESVISAIRAEDPDNLIIVGTPNWSQNVDDVIDNKIAGVNIAYGFHFYASEVSHYNNLFGKAEKAINADIPLFVTEWGVSEASGNGDFNKTWTHDWLEFMDNHQLSWCNWSVADKSETSAALLPGADEQGGWTNSELSESGVFIRNILREQQGYSNPK